MAVTEVRTVAGTGRTAEWHSTVQDWTEAQTA